MELRILHPSSHVQDRDRDVFCASQGGTRVMIVRGRERKRGDGMGWDTHWAFAFLFLSQKQKPPVFPSHIAHGRMYVTAALNT